MRPAHLILACALLIPVAGCDSGSEERSTGSDESVLIRDWLRALESGDYGHAADFFAPRALIDQGIPYRLRNRAAARLFNSGLPCRADLVEAEDEGDRVLATFRLRNGPGGSCDGFVKVLFRFRDGRFSEFIQLEQERTPGETA